MKLDALSATHGAMPSAMAAGVDTATLKSLLAGMMLFGTVPVADLLAPMPPPLPAGPGGDSDAALDAALASPTGLIRSPVVRTRPVLDADGQVTANVTRLVWKPELPETPPVKPAFEPVVPGSTSTCAR